MVDTPLHILKKYWGYDAFRPLQQDIIQSVLDGKDTLALMPTGGGKSICFQVPALCKKGICIVISPLIALMKDQVHNLRQRDIPAAAIYSGMRANEIDQAFDNCVYGNTKLLYLSPERLITAIARERITRMSVNLLAVDEAHCISQWGYDFRPPYLEIAAIRDLLPNAPILALTATATPEVVQDIQEKLHFTSKNVFQKSFERNNLAYVVLQEEGKMEKLLDILQKVKGCGVVYVRNRRKTKEIADFLQRKGISADFYHAGLNPEERSQKQDAWIGNKTRIMVSTNAFGMGIDKPDVRIVVHMELPDSLEAYFQEAGRAGRDGKKAFATLLYNQTDRLNLEKNYELAFPDMEEIRQVYRALGSYFQLAIGAGEAQSYDFDIAVFCKNFRLEAIKVLNALKALEQAGWLVLTEAVFVPSSLKILVSKEELYDYQLKKPKLNLVIKTILRTYQGAFGHFINIRENQIATFLKIPVAEVKAALQLMHQEGILHYQEQKDKPQVIFLKDRVDTPNLTIDFQLYQFRKKRHWDRIQQAISYAENPVCRSRQLLYYFGEKNDKDCGICDVCLGRTKADMSNADFDAIKSNIQEKLLQAPASLEVLVGAFSSSSQKKVLEVIQYLQDEGYIFQNGNVLQWK